MVTVNQYQAALARVARRAGVSADVVEASYRSSLKNSAASAESLFLADSVITLREKKSAPSRRAGGRAAGSRRVRGRFKGEEVR